MSGISSPIVSVPLSITTILLNWFTVNQLNITLGNSSFEWGKLFYDLFVQLFWNIFDPPPEGKEFHAFKGQLQAYLVNLGRPDFPLAKRDTTVMLVTYLHITLLERLTPQKQGRKLWSSRKLYIVAFFSLQVFCYENLCATSVPWWIKHLGALLHSNRSTRDFYISWQYG